MTQRGREPYTETFSVRLKPEDFQEFEQWAQRSGVGRSVLGRQVIMEWLHAKREAEEKKRQSNQ